MLAPSSRPTSTAHRLQATVGSRRTTVDTIRAASCATATNWPPRRSTDRSSYSSQTAHPPCLPRRLDCLGVVLLPHPADCFLRRHSVENRQRRKCCSRSSSTTTTGHLDNFTVAGAPQELLQSIQRIQPVSRNPELRPDDAAIRPRRHRSLGQRQQKVGALIRNLTELPAPHPSAPTVTPPSCSPEHHPRRTASQRMSPAVITDKICAYLLLALIVLPAWRSVGLGFTGHLLNALQPVRPRGRIRRGAIRQQLQVTQESAHVVRTGPMVVVS
jgi:hypothetical protein